MSAINYHISYHTSINNSDLDQNTAVFFKQLKQHSTKYTKDYVINGDSKESIYKWLLTNYIDTLLTSEEVRTTSVDWSKLLSTSNSSSSADVRVATDNIGQDASGTLLSLMHDEYYEAGEIPPSETYIKQIADKYGWQKTQLWLQKIWLDHFHDSHILVGLLHVLSHFPYKDVEPGAVAMALGVLQHSDMNVRDYAIKAFENWNSKKALPVLQKLNCDAKWLQNYVNQVIDVLEKEGVD